VECLGDTGDGGVHELCTEVRKRLSGMDLYLSCFYGIGNVRVIRIWFVCYFKVVTRRQLSSFFLYYLQSNIKHFIFILNML
jgi:hypothetical protein